MDSLDGIASSSSPMSPIATSDRYERVPVTVSPWQISSVTTCATCRNIAEIDRAAALVPPGAFRPWDRLPECERLPLAVAPRRLRALPNKAAESAGTNRCRRRIPLQRLR